jgi:hypothetical protein
MYVCMWCVCYTSCLSACAWSTRSMSLLSTLGSRSHTDVYITAFSLCSMSDMASLQLLVIYQVIKLSFTSLDSDIKQWSFRPCNFWRDLLGLTFEKKVFYVSLISDMKDVWDKSQRCFGRQCALCMNVPCDFLSLFCARLWLLWACSHCASMCLYTVISLTWHVCIYVCIRSIYIYICMYVCIRRMYICVYVCIRSIYLCIYLCVRSIHMCICMYIWVFLQKCRHTYTLTLVSQLLYCGLVLSWCSHVMRRPFTYTYRRVLFTGLIATCTTQWWAPCLLWSLLW